LPPVGLTAGYSPCRRSEPRSGRFQKEGGGAYELKTKPIYAQGHFFLGELYAFAGRKEETLENLTKAETTFLEMGMD
jgi:hypothetical protein